MKSPISDKIKGGDIKMKKKKKSPLADKYRKFLNNENINLQQQKRELPTQLESKMENQMKKILNIIKNAMRKKKVGNQNLNLNKNPKQNQNSNKNQNQHRINRRKVNGED